MFIHGAWLTPASWDRFRDRFEAGGFDTIAPPWPFEDAPIEELREGWSHRDRTLARLTIDKLVDHYDAEIRSLIAPPILIGHGHGGLVAQILLDRGLAAATIALAPAPIRGVLPTPRALLSALPTLLRWKSWNRVVTLDVARFVNDFAQTLPRAEAEEAYDQFVVPTPGRIFWQTAFGSGTQVNVENPNRAPILLVAGEADRTIEPAMVEAMVARHRCSPARTDYEKFAGRSHFLFAEPGWEQIADHAMEWARRHEGELAAAAARVGDEHPPISATSPATVAR
jgi:pimeloyl-ACP methyl ester carboxylesterase